MDSKKTTNHNHPQEESGEQHHQQGLHDCCNQHTSLQLQHASPMVLYPKPEHLLAPNQLIGQ
jgi:hypothetical protein